MRSILYHIYIYIYTVGDREFGFLAQALSAMLGSSHVSRSLCIAALVYGGWLQSSIISW